ncbi:hypothetical protein DFH27DRAFT_153733 [Peziza echinospora]|nr:hypothetical protein DFH27DRAFT_153733 [Peziza echinospora]
MASFLARLAGALRMVTLAGPYLFAWFLSDILLTLTIPFSAILPRQTYDFNSKIANFLWTYIHRILLLHKPQISYSGAFKDIPSHESAIVVANHVSWSDFYLVHALAIEKGMLSRCRYFAKSSLKWVPLLGWSFVALGMPLVSRNWTNDQSELEKLFGSMIRNKWPMWLVSYSEGTRYNPQKWQNMKTFAEGKGKKILTHCLYPRTKGFVTCVRHLRNPDSHIKHIYDLTLAYQYTAPPTTTTTTTSSSSTTTTLSTRPTINLTPATIYDTFSMPSLSPPWRFHVHVERFLIKDLPEDDRGVAEWLEKRWLAKDEILKGLDGEWTEFEGLGEVGYFATP